MPAETQAAEDQKPTATPETTPAEADESTQDAPEDAEGTDAPAEGGDAPDEPAKPAGDTVPLRKYMEERRRRQEAERRAADVDRQKAIEKRTEELIEEKWPALAAARLAKIEVEQEFSAREARTRDADTRASSDIKDLARSDAFFADAEAYADEIRDLMRGKDVSAEEAYMLLRGRARTREIQTQREQQAAAQRKAGASKGRAVEHAAPTAPKGGPKLDEADRKALAELQRAQPDSGWTAEKYAKVMGKG